MSFAKSEFLLPHHNLPFIFAHSLNTMVPASSISYYRADHCVYVCDECVHVRVCMCVCVHVCVGVGVCVVCVHIVCRV